MAPWYQYQSLNQARQIQARLEISTRDSQTSRSMQWWFSASTCHWYPRQLPACLSCAYQDTSPAAQQEYFGVVHLDKASFPFPRSTGDPGNSLIENTMPLAGQNAPGILALQVPYAIFASPLSNRNSSNSIYPCLAGPGKWCGCIEAWHELPVNCGTM